MSAPTVAVVGYHLEPGRVTRWRYGAYAVPDNYVDSVRRAGGLPAVIHPDDVDLDRCDALLLIGGGDVDPALYGAGRDRNAGAAYGVEPARDAAEIALLEGALARRMPVLGICRAIQVIDVAFGGTLVVDLPSAGGYGPHGVPGGDPTVHEVKVAPGSLVAAATGADVVVASCHHHQGIARIGQGLVATAWAVDGLVEAVELDAGTVGGWVVAVQWHPEDTAATDPAQQGLFDALVAHART